MNKLSIAEKGKLPVYFLIFAFNRIRKYRSLIEKPQNLYDKYSILLSSYEILYNKDYRLATCVQ